MRVSLSRYGLHEDAEPMVGLAVRVRALGVEVQVCADLLLTEPDRPTAGARLRLIPDRG